MDVSQRRLEIASRRLKLDRLPRSSASGIALFHGSLMYRDKRLAGFDAAPLVEVIEHLDQPRLRASSACCSSSASPATVVVTTPNAEYNVKLRALPAGEFRHRTTASSGRAPSSKTWAEARRGSITATRCASCRSGPKDPDAGRADADGGVRADERSLEIPELSLVVLIGASGCGKSTFARTHFKPTEVVSSDFCRGLVSDDENDQAATDDAFEALHFIAGEAAGARDADRRRRDQRAAGGAQAARRAGARVPRPAGRDRPRPAGAPLPGAQPRAAGPRLRSARDPQPERAAAPVAAQA